MGKSSKKSATKVESPASMTKPLKKGKRDAEQDLDIQVPKKQKKELIDAVQKEKSEKTVPKKVESSSSDSSASSDSEDDQKTKTVLAKEPPSKQKGDSSSDDSSSDEEPAPVKKQPETIKKDKEESSSSDDDSSSDEETAPVKKQPAAVLEKQPEPIKKDKVESSSSDDDSSSDEESAPAKKQPAALKNTKADSSSSEEESSSDEELTPAIKPTVVKNIKPAAKDSSSSEEDSDEEESDDEKPPTKKAKVSLTKTSKKESSSEESSDESDKEESKEEKVTPKKKDSDIEMVDAEQKSNAKQPKTPTTETQGGSKTLFAGNLSFQIKRSDIENFFKEAGEVVDVRFSSYDDGTFKGYGHVEFASPEEAQKALELNGKMLLGRDVRLDLANERGQRNSNPGRKGEGSQSRTIFVRGFNSSLGEDEIKKELRSLFSNCGEVTRVHVPTDRETGACRGLAYIDLTSGFDEALQLRGSEIGGWNIHVEESRPRDSDEGRSSNRAPGRAPRGRYSDRGAPRGRSSDRGAPRGRSSDRGAPRGRFSTRGRGPSKPSVIESALGKKTVFKDED
ncbi:hypothetical protein ARALYDRAFT_479366 [Arabidopsis lyrata subsp. lyrata]|uniref:RRM domain-containing protein n=1 Tax=Arabidopsis lyrata subsp. lyrata TaxID=81972 RepID=D7L929_ARALL|nr:hypothetical protein ARALYDRAFT_479366 [Arabidopsis lyrata subsp. lyrata]